MKLKKLLKVLDDSEPIRVFDDKNGTCVFENTVSLCNNRKLLNRNVSYLFPSGYRLEVFLK